MDIVRYCREAIDYVRVDAVNRYSCDPIRRQLINGLRWRLLWNHEKLSRSDKHRRVDELVEVNKRLSLAYIKKKHLNHLWTFTDQVAARFRRHHWFH
tara:strand:+ start:1170 stop:1460 length:291 start_codon:yes stop_codon:yes gene_type:complete